MVNQSSYDIFVVDGEHPGLHFSLFPGDPPASTVGFLGALILPWCSTVEEVQRKALQFRRDAGDDQLVAYVYQDYNWSNSRWIAPAPGRY
jgi:hypothetical protein